MNLGKQLFITVVFVINGICNAQNTLEITPWTFENREGHKVDSEKGSFVVKENRTKRNSREIELKFVRFKSTNPNPGYPIIYLAGGPGGSGIRTAQGDRFDLFMALREVADVIAFDQRGTGESNSIPNCEVSVSFPLEQVGDEQSYLKKLKANANACLDYWVSHNVDVSAYNTIENANDLERLRLELGVEKLNLWGISYGSHLALAYIKQYPNNVEHVVLASLEGLNQTIKRPKYNQQFLAYLANKVKADPIAAKYYPNVLGMMNEVFDALEKEPVVAEFKNRRTAKTHKVTISKFDLQLVTSFFYLKNPEQSKNMPYIFYQMKHGDYSDVAPKVAQLKQFMGRSLSRLMPLAMDVASGISSKRTKRIQKEKKNALLGATTNFPFPQIGEELAIDDLGNAFRKNPKSDVSALFFSGTLDGRTYLPAAAEIIHKFKNGRHVIIDGAGHDLFLSTPKVKALMLRFLNGDEIESQTINIPMPKWKLPNQEVSN